MIRILIEASMLNNKMFTAFGIVIESQIELPELFTTGIDMPPQVKISFGHVPRKLDNAITGNPWYEIANGQFLLRVEGIADYYVADGNAITIEPNEKATQKDIRVFLLNSVMAQLLHQRGLFLLHGSGAIIKNKAVLFLGSSSTGKTSIALDLYKRGYPLSGDELCAVTIENGKPKLLPGIPQLNVWEDTLVNSGEIIGQYKTIRNGINKYVVSVKENFCMETPEISGIIILNNNKSQVLDSKQVLGAQKFKKMMLNAFRLNITEKSGPKESNYLHAITIANYARISELSFNHSLHTPSELFELLSKELNISE